MTLKLNFSRIAKESAIDFFAPLTAMYKVLTSDLATAFWEEAVLPYFRLLFLPRYFST